MNWVEGASFLVRHGADLTLQRKGLSPLHMYVFLCASVYICVCVRRAAEENRPEVLGYFLSLPSCQPNIANHRSVMPLHKACGNGCTSVVAMLVAAGEKIVIASPPLSLVPGFTSIHR